jgi:hypothetical protein
LDGSRPLVHLVGWMPSFQINANFLVTSLLFHFFGKPWTAETSAKKLACLCIGKAGSAIQTAS